MSQCRCGFGGDGEHPCHANGYTCKKASKQKFYNPRPVALSGQQFKVEVVDTFSCDECWNKFLEMIKNYE